MKRTSNKINESHFEINKALIVDWDYYDSFLKLKELVNEIGFLHNTSIKGLVIDFRNNPSVVKKWIGQLPKEESNILYEKYKAISSYKMQMVAIKSKAYGNVNSSYHKIVKPAYDVRLDEFGAEIIEYFSKFYSIKELIHILKKEKKLDIHKEDLALFRAKHFDKIEELKREYKDDLDVVRLFHKKSRLEEYSDLYEDRKLIYEINGKRGDDMKLLLQILKEVKQEVEGDLVLGGSVDLNLQGTVQSHIISLTQKELCIKDIIISRVATKLRCNPLFLLNKLHNSHYNKYNGFGKTLDLSDDNPIYPSAMVYDMDSLKKNAENNRNINLANSKIEDVPFEEVKLGDELKEDIISKIKRKRAEINDTKDKIDKN